MRNIQKVRPSTGLLYRHCPFEPCLCAGVTGQVLAGDQEIWGGYGFDIALNMETDAIIVEGGASIAAV